MEVGDFNIFGHNILNQANSHWIRTYSGLLMAISSTKVEEVIEMLDSIEKLEDKHMHNTYILDFLMKKGAFYMDGYTLSTVSEWFLDFCNKWKDKNLDAKKRMKEKKIEILKKELEELEK